MLVRNPRITCPPSASLLRITFRHSVERPRSEKITSRVEHGTSQVRGESVNVDVFTEQPGKQAIVRHLAVGRRERVRRALGLADLS